MISIKRYTWEMCFKFEIVVMPVLSYIIARLKIRKLVKFQGSHHLNKALGDSLLPNHCLQECLHHSLRMMMRTFMVYPHPSKPLWLKEASGRRPTLVGWVSGHDGPVLFP